MRVRWFMGIGLWLLLSACAGSATKPDLREVAPVVSPPVAHHTSGSLWAADRGSLFYDIKARMLGDVITVAIFERASASKEAKTSTGRDSEITADISKLLGLEKKLPGLFNLGMDPTALLDATASNSFSGGGKTSRKEDLVATLATQIIEVLPNGNLRIKGNKTVTVNNEMQIVTLSGTVRSSDISPSNIVDSKNILNARIAYVGNGAVSDKQQQGWLVKALDRVWPF